MAITGASRKQAGLYYDKGGAAINVLHPDFGAKGDGTTDDAVAINAALTAGAGLVPVIIPRTASYYKIGSVLTIPSNTHLQVDGTVVMSTRIDNLFIADTQSNIHISGSGKIKGTNGVATSGSLERLLFFTNSSDISVRGVELSLSVYGCHFNNCTDFDFDAVVRDIGQASGTSGLSGYGLIAGLNCTRFRIAGRWYNIGRHAIYISAGSTAGAIDNVVIDNTWHTAIMFASFNTENLTKNISIGSAVLRNVGIAGAGAINVAKGSYNIAISSDVIIDTSPGYGINIEGDSTYTPATNPQIVTIGSPILANIASDAIRVVNAAAVTIGKPRIKTCGGAGIRVTTSGTGTGSFTDDVSIQSYDIDTPTANAVIVAGDALTTNVNVGRGNIRNPVAAKFGIPTTTTVKYTGPGTTFGFTEINLAASQTNNPFVANVAGPYWEAPEAGYLIEMSGMIVSAAGALTPVTAGTLTIQTTVNGLAGATPLRVDLTSGSTFYTSSMGVLAVAAGDRIGVMYTATAGFLPTGTSNCVAQVRFIPFP